MKHSALSEEEIAKSGLLEPGVYDFTIVEAKETVSGSGNDMFALKLNVFDKEGKTVSLLDWVLPSFPKKFKHLHDALGLLEIYAKKDTKPDDLVGKSGKLMLKIGEPYTDKNGMERVNNSVEDYVKRDSTEAYKAAIAPKEDLDGDAIPF